MNKKLVFATRNDGKLREIREFFQGTEFGAKYQILSLDDVRFTAEIIEDGTTFEENAAKKAAAVCRACGLLTLADDSGLVIDALDGQPGVDSANFMGIDTPYSTRNARIIEMLEGIPTEKRTARFVCVIAIARPTYDVFAVRGSFEGQIAFKAAGDAGFGYDPIFLLPERNMTTAQLSIREKNRISHRGIALTKAVAELEKL